LPFSHLCLRLFFQLIEVAQLYRNRWTIEEFFQSVTLNLRRNSNPAYPSRFILPYGIGHRQYSGGYPSGTCWGAWVGKIEAGLSDFYVVDEISIPIVVR